MGKNVGFLFLDGNYLMSIQKFVLGINYVSNAEISNFSQGQGNQGITRRCTNGTPHK
jgi:hypothetical protein